MTFPKPILPEVRPLPGIQKIVNPPARSAAALAPRGSVRAIPLFLALALAPMMAGAQTYLDTAKAGETYRIQGEYSGTIGAKAFGAQVVAWGNGKFVASMLPGGLPGAGWGATPTDFKDVNGSTSGSNTVFSGSNYSMVIKAGGYAIEGTGPDGAIKLNKVYRESQTLNWKGPADAVKLFDGTQAVYKANWSSGNLIEGQYLSEGADCNKAFTDHTLHLEFRPPFEPLEDGQGRGNSGVYVQGRYEAQVLDSFGWMKGTNHGGAEGWAGGIYDTRPADFNMAIPPLRWATYDIHLVHPKFNGNSKTTNGRMTIWLNGVKIQNNVELPGTTPGNLEGESPSGGKLHLQNHGGPMWYRNIWVVPGRFEPIPSVGLIARPDRGGFLRPSALRAEAGSLLAAPVIDALGARRPSASANRGPLWILPAEVPVR